MEIARLPLAPCLHAEWPPLYGNASRCRTKPRVCKRPLLSPDVTVGRWSTSPCCRLGVRAFRNLKTQSQSFLIFPFSRLKTEKESDFSFWALVSQAWLWLGSETLSHGSHSHGGKISCDLAAIFKLIFWVQK